MSTKAEAERAVEIRDRLDATVAYLNDAVKNLAEAELHAGLDFDHNQDTLNEALGALRLVRKVVITEQNVWHGYAEARTRGGF